MGRLRGKPPIDNGRLRKYLGILHANFVIQGLNGQPGNQPAYETAVNFDIMTLGKNFK